MKIERDGNFTSYDPEGWAEDVALTIAELSGPSMLYNEIMRTLAHNEPLTPSRLERWASRLPREQKAHIRTYTWRTGDKTTTYFIVGDRGALKLAYMS